MKKLTIITVNYNNAAGLQRTIDSIVNQTFTDYEWIVVDGGSTDGSKEILEKYQDRFAWWCSEPDKGVYNAMNKGIAHSTGEYINFMNSGDIMATPTILEEVFSMEPNADILYGRMGRKSIDGVEMGVGNLKYDLQWYDMYYDNLCHQAEFSKRELYDYKVFDEQYKVLADWEWNTYMISHKRVSTMYIPKVVCIYEADGLSEKQKKQGDAELLKIKDRYFSTLTEEDLVEIKYLHVLNQYKISKKLYYLLSRIANRYRKMKAKKSVRV